MKRTPLSLLSFTLPTVPAAALIFCPPALHAADRFWIDPAGGPFADTTNWSATAGGAGGATVPVAADVANFTLNNTYTISLGAAVTLNAIDVENGNITLDLGGFTHTLTSGGASFVGEAAGQTGRLTLTDGTLGVDTTGDNIEIGHLAGSTGFLTVTTGGILGTAALRPDLFVGAAGTGTLTVNDNGRIDAAAFTVGNNTGTTGTAAITGPNAVADFSGPSSIGSAGTGTLSVLNGGTLTNGNTVVLGSNLGTDGTATISGTGSSWEIVSTTTIGSSGDGTLTVSAGGLVSTANTVTLGSTATGFGTATVSGTGSQWNLAGSHIIGSSGLGVMTVSSGGEVSSTSFANLGLAASGEGRVTVTGAGSQWTLGNTLTAGNAGEGGLTVSAGGGVSATSLTLGNTSTGIGEATITGTGSKLTASAFLTVASSGTGTLDVSSGGELNVGTNLAVNDPAGAPVGTLDLDGGLIYVAGAFTNAGVFTFTDGLLRVAGNFQPSAAANPLIINGNYHGDLPVLDLIGTGTTTNVTGLSVGPSRRGELRLRQGRVINTGSNQVSIGALAGGEGTLSVESGAQLTSSSSVIHVGGTGGTAGGTGTLDIRGGLVDAQQVSLFRDGTINLDGGTLALDSTPVFDGRFNWTSGTLRFDAATSLTVASAPKFFGPDVTLKPGQTLSSTAAVTLNTPLIVDGGRLNAATLVNQSRLELRSGSLFNLQNEGQFLGDGLIIGFVTNTASGRIRVDAGGTLSLTGGFAANAGQINLQGGTLEIPSIVTNGATGFITGRGALFTDGIVNNGQMAFSGGTMDLFGDVTLNAGSRIATSGAGSVTTFWDDVIHNGTEIFTGVGCSTVFFGGQSGGGSYTGSGTIYFIGDLRPGSSPAAVSMAPQVVFSPSNALTLEIGGLTAGTQHDKLTFTHAASPQVEWGGTLAVTLINGFTPAAGQSFDVLDFDASRDAGTFSSITLPALAPGLSWNTSQLYTTGTLSIVTGVTFAQWATASGIPGALPGGDHDNDGYDNAVEFALGLFPNQPGTVAPIIDLHPYAGGDRLRARFTRPLDRTGVTLVVQASADLVTWTDVATSVDSAVFTGPGFVSENRAHPLTEPGLVEARDILTTATAPRRQMRVRITLAP